MATIARKKENVTVTLSPYLKKQLDEMVETGEFSSVSDLVTMALMEFIAKYNAKKEANSHKPPISKKQPITIIEEGIIEDEDTEI